MTEMTAEKWKAKIGATVTDGEWSPLMGAVAGAICQAHWVDPQVVGLTVTWDGHVMGRTEGAPGFDLYLGAQADLDENWGRLMRAAGLTMKERQAASQAFAWVTRGH